MSRWIWFILLLVGYFIVKFLLALRKDNYDLRGTTVAEKFAFIVHELNEAAYEGNGSVTILDKRNFNLYANGSNQIIYFTYNTGSLTITWKYKFFQKEVIHKRAFHNVRNISLFTQERIAEAMKEEMIQIIEKHQKDVLMGK